MAHKKGLPPYEPVIEIDKFYDDDNETSRKMRILNTYKNTAVIPLIDEFTLMNLAPQAEMFIEEDFIELFKYVVEYAVLNNVPYYLEQEELIFAAAHHAVFRFGAYTSLTERDIPSNERRKVNLASDIDKYQNEINVSVKPNFNNLLKSVSDAIDFKNIYPTSTVSLNVRNPTQEENKVDYNHEFITDLINDFITYNMMLICLYAERLKQVIKDLGVERYNVLPYCWKTTPSDKPTDRIHLKQIDLILVY